MALLFVLYARWGEKMFWVRMSVVDLVSVSSQDFVLSLEAASLRQHSSPPLSTLLTPHYPAHSTHDSLVQQLPNLPDF